MSVTVSSLWAGPRREAMFKGNNERSFCPAPFRGCESYTVAHTWIVVAKEKPVGLGNRRYS